MSVCRDCPLAQDAWLLIRIAAVNYGRWRAAAHWAVVDDQVNVGAE